MVELTRSGQGGDGRFYRLHGSSAQMHEESRRHGYGPRYRCLRPPALPAPQSGRSGSDGPDVLRFWPLGTLGHFVFDLLAVLEAPVPCAHHVGGVDEHVFFPAGRRDKPEAPVAVEELHSSSFHVCVHFLSFVVVTAFWFLAVDRRLLEARVAYCAPQAERSPDSP